MNNKELYIFWLLSVLCVATLSGQSYFETYLHQRDSVGGHRQEWVDSLLATAIKESKMDQAISIAHKEAIYFRKRNIDLAINYSLRELAWYQQLDRLDADYTQALYNTGRFYGMDRQYFKSRYYYNKIVDSSEDSLLKARSYCELGEVALALNDPYAAEDYYRAGLEILEVIGQQKLWIYKALNLALVLEEINTAASLKSKFALLKKIDSLLPSTPISTRNEVIFNNHYASYYNNNLTFDFEKSKQYYLKSIERSKAAGYRSFLASTYANLANLYAQQRNDSTLYYINESKALSRSSTQLIRLLNIESDYYIAQQQPQKALKAVQLSLKENLAVELSTDQVPSREQISMAHDQKLLLWALTKKAELYTRRYTQSGFQQDLELGFKNLKAADQVADLLFVGNRENASKLLWRKYASRIYGNGVYLAMELDLDDLAYYFAEKKQAVLLSQQIFLNRRLESLPPAVADQITAYSQRINQMELQALSASDFKRETLYKVKRERAAYLDSLSSLGIELHESLAWQKDNSLKTAQSLLDSQTAVLHFLWGGGSGVSDLVQVLILTSEGLSLVPLVKKTELRSQIDRFMVAVSHPFENPVDAANFYQNSHELYSQLFPQEIQEALKNKSDLVIIAEDELGYLPFEALIVKEKQPEYLFENYTLSYAQSIAFMGLNSSELPETKTQDYYGMAPVNFDKLDLFDLPYTRDEITAANALYKGSLVTGVDASRKAFLKQASKSRILHLATHAASNEQPWIAFQDSLVYLKDLYSLKLNNELVVLSACNTATGQYQKGEGIASLTRGFFYSGSRAVVSTRWNTNDKATREILTDFYQFLHSGENKAKALQLALLNYLKTAELSEASPYYWSTFALIGDRSPVKPQGSNTFWLWILLGGLFVGFFFWKKIFKR